MAMAETSSEPENLVARDARVRAAQAGDTTAFEALYREHVGRVYALCLRTAGQPADARTKRTAMIARVHHCMVDGVSGVDLLKIILDISPEVPRVLPAPERPPQPPRPDATRRFFDTLLGNMQEGMNRWMEFQTGLLNLTQALTNEQTRQSMRETSGTIPLLATPVSLLPFNRPCSGDRKLVWSTFSFAEARAIRAALGGTVNDVVLTTLSGAVSRYVELHGQRTASRQLRVMVPVSLRQQDQRGALGNLVSMLPVEIPLDMPDPVLRLM
jgi:hypothetical protein